MPTVANFVDEIREKFPDAVVLYAEENGTKVGTDPLEDD